MMAHITTSGTWVGLGCNKILWDLWPGLTGKETLVDHYSSSGFLLLGNDDFLEVVKYVQH